MCIPAHSIGEHCQSTDQSSWVEASRPRRKYLMIGTMPYWTHTNTGMRDPRKWVALGKDSEVAAKLLQARRDV